MVSCFLLPGELSARLLNGGSSQCCQMFSIPHRETYPSAARHLFLSLPPSDSGGREGGLLENWKLLPCLFPEKVHESERRGGGGLLQNSRFPGAPTEPFDLMTFCITTEQQMAQCWCMGSTLTSGCVMNSLLSVSLLSRRIR